MDIEAVKIPFFIITYITFQKDICDVDHILWDFVVCREIILILFTGPAICQPVKGWHCSM